MSGTRASIGLLAGALAAIWLVGAGAYALTTQRERAEMRARYGPVNLSRSAAAQGSPEFVALPEPVRPASGLVQRRGSSSGGVHLLPLRSAADVRWIVRWEGLSRPAIEWPLLAHAHGDTPATVVREAFQAEGVPIAEDAVVVEWVPSRGGVVLDRGEETRTWFVGVAGLVSLIVVVLAAMLRALAWFEKRRQCPVGAARHVPSNDGG